MHVTLKQINNFIALSETLHLTEASQKLFLTPSALHKQIRNLEEQLGNKLFNTKGKKIELTGFGESLLPQSRSMMSEYDKFVRKAQTSLIDDSPVSINVDFSHQLSILENVKAFKEKHPNIIMDIKVSLWEEQQICLSNPKGTLYFSGELPTINNNLNYQILKKSKYVFVVGKSHPIFDKNSLLSDELHKFTFALPAAQLILSEDKLGSSYKKIHDFIHNLNQSISLLNLLTFASIRSATEAGLCIGCLPKCIVEKSIKDGVLKIINIENFPEIYWELFAIYHQSDALDNKTLTFLEFLKKSYVD